MDEIIQIKCPFCGAVLSVKNQPGIETKNVTCPVCKHKYPFIQYKKMNQPPIHKGEHTEYPDSTNRRNRNQDEHTSISIPGINSIIGEITVLETGDHYKLNNGKNVIGRKSSKSTSDIMIDTGDLMTMSREHLVIEVKNIPGKGYVHYASLFKEQVNETFIGNERLFYGDTVVLKNGDCVKLPGFTLKFMLPDYEATNLYR